MDIFTERQRFSAKLIYGFSLGMTVFLVVLFRWTGEEPNPGLFASLLMVALAAWLLEICELKTEINKEGIKVQLEPFHRKPQFIDWQDIESAYIRTYSPLWEFGGWGLRFGLSGKAYIISGNRGLQLILKDGRHLLIGTQKDLELEQFLKRYDLEKQ